MNTVTLRLNDADFKRAVAKLKDRAPRAIARAINRAIVSTRVVQVRAIASDVGLAQGVVRSAMSIDEATPTKQFARLNIRGARIPLIKFGAKGPEPSAGRGRGVRARLKGGQSRYPNAFIATMRSGHRGVFQRASTLSRKSRGSWSKNLPIYELRGPSLALVFEKHAKAGLDAGQASLVKNLRHEFKWALEQSSVTS